MYLLLHLALRWWETTHVHQYPDTNKCTQPYNCVKAELTCTLVVTCVTSIADMSGLTGGSVS